VKLARRLAGTLMAVTGVVLLVVEVGVFAIVARSEAQALDDAVRSDVAGATRTFAELHARGEVPSNPMSELLVSKRRYAVLYDHEGRVIATSRSYVGGPPPLPALPPPGEAVLVDVKTAKNTLRAALAEVPGTRWFLLFGQPRDAYDQETRFLIEVLLAGFAVGVGAAAFAARYLAGRLTDDVQRLVALARRVTSGDLRARASAGRWESDETAQLARDLDAMIERLAELVEKQRVFVSYAAHELRSPITALRGELQLALRRPRTAEQYQQTIVDLLADVEQLRRLAEDLLTLARIHTHADPEQVARVDAVLIEALRQARGLLDARGVAIEEPGPDAPERAEAVVGRELDLARALRNLIDNAALHGPERGRVRLCVEPAGDVVRIAVEDEGPGVPEGEREHLFEPFFRGAHASAVGGGSGLGLPIVRSVVEASGGSVSLESTASGGARFVLALQRAREPTPSTSGAASSP
jgi:two-component system heavy metal sensor histidine kinase CusS